MTGPAPAPAPQSVREAAFGVLREHGLITVFGNPGSTEVPMLSALPGDFRFMLSLHEASAVGIATGWALARAQPALVVLHTTAGLGNAVGALATARVNRAPLVVLVGQQDRRHLALEPFLAGHLQGLAGDYLVWRGQPPRAQDVPGALGRAYHEAVTAGGPALVIVPMDDWLAVADESRERAAPLLVKRAGTADPCSADELAALLAAARSPALVVGAGADDARTWRALTGLATRLGSPVWQEPFGARAGFPQDHPRFAGHLPASASGLRAALAAHDLVLVAGAAAFRQFGYEPGPLLELGTRVVVLTDDPAEAHRSVADTAFLGPVGPLCEAVAERVPPRPPPSRAARRPARPRRPPGPGAPMRPGHLFDALAARLPAEAVLLEESPSSRPELHDRVLAGTPFGFLSAAMGGLGFALPAAIGVRLALPGRPVVAVLGDGSSLYSPQALWTAAHYRVGVLFIILRNGGYAIMDQLARSHGGKPQWPGFDEVDLTALAASLGCAAQRVYDYEGLLRTLDDVLPALASRSDPLVIEVPVAA
jgi:benzoylformate decarboxylase